MTYGSAKDLPSVREMQQGLSLMKMMQSLLPKGQRKDVRRIQRTLDHLTQTVDAFYALLGSRHWVFHEDLSVEEIDALIRTHQGDASSAERAFVAWYQAEGRIEHLIRRLSWHEAWRARQPLLRMALVDYANGRFYAVIQVLLSVMDGFVNDLNPANRKGLHARDAEEMDAWDSVVGHHDGLTAAHATFNKSFKRLNEDPVHELYRNGIVHGMLTNYDNDIVATKAWNRLFALSDWARSLQALAREDLKSPSPTLRESLARYAQIQEVRRAGDLFAPIRLAPGEPGFEDHPVLEATRRYLDAWQRRRYGPMSSLIYNYASPAVSPGQVRRDYADCTLNSFRIECVAEEGPAVCTAQVELSVNGKLYHPILDWLHQRADEGLAVAGAEQDDWRLISWGAAWMLGSPED